MRRSQSQDLQSLHFGCTRIPGATTTLAVTGDDKRAVEEAEGPSQAHGRVVTLVRPDGEPFAILRRTEIYGYNKEERIIRTWVTNAVRYPYVKEVIDPAGDWLIGGDLQVLEPIKYEDGLDHFRLSPRQLRKEFDRRAADAVFAFQLRGPFHNGRAMFINDVRKHLLGMGYKTPILLLHPLGGFTEPCGLPLSGLMEQYCKVLEDGVLNPTTSVLAIFPSPMNYPGQAEVQWHAKARINAGSNLYIIDDFPGESDYPNMFCIEQGTIIFNHALGLDKIQGYRYWEALHDKEKKDDDSTHRSRS